MHDRFKSDRRRRLINTVALTKTLTQMNGNQTCTTDGQQNDSNRYQHIKTNVNGVNGDVANNVSSSALLIDAYVCVQAILQQTRQKNCQTEIRVFLARAPRLTSSWPFDFDPTIERDEREYPREAKVQLVIKTEAKTHSTRYGTTTELT
jgi:hypothetical protein